MTGLSIVIPVHNNADHLAAQLDAVKAGMVEPDSVEVVVVDNQSTDGSANIARRWAEHHQTVVSVVPADAKPGEPYARNVGYRAASYDRIAFCDADDVVRPGWVEAMRGALSQHSYVTGPVHTDGLNPPWLARVRGSVFDDLARLDGLVPYAHGCNMGFQRKTLDALDGFDESFMIGCDVEIAIRAWKLGIELCWEPVAGIDYRLRQSAGDLYQQGRAYGQARRRTRALLGESVPTASDARANARRVIWLIRKLPRATADRATRARWIWVAAQLDGELRSILARTGR